MSSPPPPPGMIITQPVAAPKSSSVPSVFESSAVIEPVIAASEIDAETSETPPAKLPTNEAINEPASTSVVLSDEEETRRQKLLAAVIWYVETLGITVIPGHYPDPAGPTGCSCHKNDCKDQAKHPPVFWTKTVNHVNTATDAEKMWAEHPWNIFALVGPRQGLFVFDIDPRNGGDASFAQLKKQLDGIIDFDSTYHYNTSRGGTHYYFKVDPDDLESWKMLKHISVNIRPGIEFKRSPGYVVAAPSRHISGENYTRPDNSPLVITELASATVAQLKTRVREGSAKPQEHDNLFSTGSSVPSFAALAASNTAMFENLLDQLRKKEPMDGSAARAVTYYKCYGGFPGERKLIDGEGRNDIWFSLAQRFVSDYMSRDVFGFQTLLDANEFDYSKDYGSEGIPPKLMQAAKEFNAAIFDPPYYQDRSNKFVRAVRTAIIRVIEGDK